MRDAILVLEVNTLRTRATALDAGLNHLAQETQAISQHHPQSGWIEHSPEELRSAMTRTCNDVIRQVGIGRIAGLVLVNDRESVAVWERASGKAIYPVIGGRDVRTAKICQNLKEKRREPMLHYRTGLFLEPDHPATKLAWILENVPEAHGRARQGELACGTLDSWALCQLSGNASHVTDHGNASRTLLYDLYTRHWEPQLLAAFDIPAVMLPRLLATDDQFGQTEASLFGETLPIHTVLTRQQAGLYFQNGPAGETLRGHYGRDFLLQSPIGHECAIQTNLLTSVAWTRDNRTEYFFEGPSLSGSSVLDWLRDGLGLVSGLEEAEGMAAGLPDTGGVYFVPALSGLGGPHGDATARGAMVGLTARTGRPQIVRALLEGLAHQMADVASLIEKGARKPAVRLRADGDLASSDFLMQFQANILGIPVERPKQLDTPLYGAALLASQITGIRPISEESDLFTSEKIFEPTISESERKRLRFRWLDAVERARGWERGSAEES